MFDDDYPCCFICGRNGQSDPLERHHIFGGANRKKSEEYKLKVLLCADKCHRNGANAAHMNADTAQMLHEYGQNKFESEHPNLDFMSIFGKNYL